MAVRSSRVPSSTCYCPARRAAHVHCFCVICDGKAVNYRTQISHLNSSAFCDEVTPTISEEETVVENETRPDHEETGVDDRDPDCIEGLLFSSFKLQNLIVRKSRSSASLRKDKIRRPVDHKTYFLKAFFSFVVKIRCKQFKSLYVAQKVVVAVFFFLRITQNLMFLLVSQGLMTFVLPVSLQKSMVHLKMSLWKTIQMKRNNLAQHLDKQKWKMNLTICVKQ